MSNNQSSTSSIEIKRSTSVARSRRLTVKINGEQAGLLHGGETLTVEVSPGEHTLTVHLDLATSDPLVIHLEPGQQEKLVADVVQRGILNRLFASVFDSAGTYTLLSIKPASSRS